VDSWKWLYRSGTVFVCRKKNEKKKRSAQKTIYKFYCWLENASLVCSIKRQILTEYKREG